MFNRTRILIVSGLVAIGAIAGTSAALASSGDTDTPITGDALERASAAALEHTGGGSVTETEVGDEESYYEVEITLEDGRQIDVQLDEGFAVVGDEVDTEEDKD